MPIQYGGDTQETPSVFMFCVLKDISYSRVKQGSICRGGISLWDRATAVLSAGVPKLAVNTGGFPHILLFPPLGTESGFTDFFMVVYPPPLQAKLYLAVYGCACKQPPVYIAGIRAKPLNHELQAGKIENSLPHLELNLDISSATILPNNHK